MQVILQELELLRDAGLAVVVTAQSVSEDGNGPELIDDRAEASVNHLGIVDRVAVGDVRGGKVGRGRRRRQRQGVGNRRGGVVGAAQKQVSRVVVQAIHGQTKGVNDVRRDTGEDGMALREESIEGTAEPIIIQFVGGDAPEIFGAAFFGPASDMDQGQRLR